MFCPNCGSYVNDLSKICTICNCDVDIASSKEKISKISLIKNLNRFKITEPKKNKKTKQTKKSKNQNNSKSKSNSKGQKGKVKAKNKKSKSKTNSKGQKGKVKAKNKKSKSKNKSKKNKKLKMPKKINGATGRIEYNNGYAIIEGMSASGGRMRKGSFKKRRNGERVGFFFYS